MALNLTGKKKPVDEKPNKDAELADAIGELPITNDDSMGTFTEEVSEEDQFVDPYLSVKTGKVGEKLGEYQKELFEDAKKNPDSYTVKTSKGIMTIKEAFERGWDPTTDEFGAERESFDWRKELDESGLPEGERENLRGMLSMPEEEMGGMPPEMAGAEAMGAEGLPLGQGMPEEEAPQAAGNPLAGMLGGGSM